MVDAAADSIERDGIACTSKLEQTLFDDRLGLIGRYTPAAANEMIRCAVDHPYKTAAETFTRSHAFRVSADTIREIVGLYRGRSSAFVKGVGTGERDEADARAEIVCVMGDGTGMPMRRECLRGIKGKNGRAKTREVKAGAIFVASRTRDNEPHRDLDTTTYVATTHRREKFGKCLRNEFDRRFAALPETVLYITDGGKWLHTIHECHFPFAVEILDVHHALEHLRPLMLGLGIREGTKEWKYRHHYWSECIKAGKARNVLDYIWKNMKARTP